MGKKCVVLQLETLEEGAEQILKGKADCHFAADHQAALAIAAKHPVTAIITRGKGQVDKELISACKKLKVISRAGVGLDNVDITAASSQGVQVLNLPGSNAATVAEHTFALMLALNRNLHSTISAVRNDDWASRADWSGIELRGKTLGVLGLGHVGSKVAKIGKAFGMKVCYWDVYVNDKKYKYKSLEKVLKTSDIVSIHLPLVGETKQVIDEDKIEIMQKGSILINCARGEVVDEKAILKALDSGQLAGYGADVQSDGTIVKQNPLLAHSKAYFTPHVASLTDQTYKEICTKAVNNLLLAANGKAVDKKCIFNRKLL